MFLHPHTRGWGLGSKTRPQPWPEAGEVVNTWLGSGCQDWSRLIDWIESLIDLPPRAARLGPAHGNASSLVPDCQLHMEIVKYGSVIRQGF